MSKPSGSKAVWHVVYRVTDSDEDRESVWTDSCDVLAANVLDAVAEAERVGRGIVAKTGQIWVTAVTLTCEIDNPRKR